MAVIAPHVLEALEDGVVVGEDQVRLADRLGAEELKAAEVQELDRSADAVVVAFGVDAPLREWVAAVEGPDARLLQLPRDGPGDAAEGEGVSAVAALDDIRRRNRLGQLAAQALANAEVLPGGFVEGQGKEVE